MNVSGLTAKPEPPHSGHIPLPLHLRQSGESEFRCTFFPVPKHSAHFPLPGGGSQTKHRGLPGPSSIRRFILAQTTDHYLGSGSVRRRCWCLCAAALSVTKRESKRENDGNDSHRPTHHHRDSETRSEVVGTPGVRSKIRENATWSTLEQRYAQHQQYQGRSVIHQFDPNVKRPDLIYEQQPLATLHKQPTQPRDTTAQLLMLKYSLECIKIHDRCACD